MSAVTLREFIGRLQELERQHGGDDVVMLTGLYGSRVLIEDVINCVTREKCEKNSCIVIKTDLWTG